MTEEKIEKKRIQAMKENDNKRRKLWILIARKEIPKVSKQICFRQLEESTFFSPPIRWYIFSAKAALGV